MANELALALADLNEEKTQAWVKRGLAAGADAFGADAQAAAALAARWCELQR